MNLSERLGFLADSDPAAEILHFVGPERTERVSRSELHDAMQDAARALQGAGVAAAGTVVLVPTGNDLDSVVRILGSFRAGVIPVVMPRGLTEDAVVRALSRSVPDGSELPVYRSLREGIVHRVQPDACADDEPHLYRDRQNRRPAYYLCTSGTTGEPKVAPQWHSPHYSPLIVPNALVKAGGWVTGQRQLICNPIHHAGPFVALVEGIMDGNLSILTASGEGAAALSVAADSGVEWWQATPPQLAQALAEDPAPGRRLHRLRSVFHGVFPCPEELKRAWIGALGPQRVREWYGSTEGYGYTVVRGDEWLDRPGTVGKGLLTRLAILDEEGRPLPAGVEGRVYMRRLGSAPVGVDDGAVRGFRWVGDRGHLDSDGYLFLAGREPVAAA
jgi:bile acid-coenzyme A ligase